MRYDAKVTEAKWQKIWEDTGVFSASDNSDKPKFYGLAEDHVAVCGQNA